MRTATSLLLGALAACGGGQGGPAGERPNLILLLTDDQRYDTLSCNGQELIQTPNIDLLASEGARFTRAYVTTSLCCPARASLYTGLYAHAHGIRNNEDEVDFLRQHPGFPELLQAAGYATGFFGKWHIHNPDAAPQPGFDRWVSFEGQGQYVDELFNLDGERRRIPGFNTDVLFDLVLEWLAEERGAPFLCVVSLKNLHRPYFVPERHRGVLPRDIFPLPESFEDDPSQLPSFLQRARTTLRNRFFDEGGTHDENIRGYHALVLSVDDNVGRLLDALDGSDQAEQTAILLTSDGGFLFGEHGLYRKRTAYEESVRVPLVLRYPAEVPAGLEPDELVLGVDVMPTLLDWAGVKAPELQHGTSLRPLWVGEDPDWRKDFLYIDGWGGSLDGPQELAVVGQRYKLVRYRRGTVEEALFDRESDSKERTNRVDDPALADTVEAMRARLATSLAEVGAPATWLEAIEIEGN